MRKIKILQVITLSAFPGISPLGGGAQAVVRLLLDNLDKEEFDVSLAVGNEGFLTRVATCDGVKVIVFPELVREISPFNDCLALIKLWKFFRKERFDLVHTHSSKAGIIGRVAAKLAGVPVVVHTVHGFPFHDFNGSLQNRFYEMLERFAAKMTDHLICVSEKDRIKALQEGLMSEDDITTIPPGIDLRKYDLNVRANLKEKEFQFAPSDQVVGMIARLDKQKAPKDFVLAAERVLSQLKQVKFILVGDGELWPFVTELVKAKNLSSNFVLAGSRTDIPELLASMDIYVLPSLWEGLSISLLEAMAMGKAVVATDIPGTREVVDNGVNGVLVPPSNPEALGNAILSLLRDPQRARAMGRAARKLVEQEFGVKNMTMKTRGLYRRMIERRCSRSTESLI
jgi:glycosyltransferase involved in cell wall biosynthesis